MRVAICRSVRTAWIAGCRAELYLEPLHRRSSDQRRAAESYPGEIDSQPHPARREDSRAGAVERAGPVAGGAELAVSQERRGARAAKRSGGRNRGNRRSDKFHSLAPVERNRSARLRCLNEAG